MTTGLIIVLAGVAEAAAERVHRARGWAIERVGSADAASEVLLTSRTGPVLIAADAVTAGADFFLKVAHAAAVGSPDAQVGALYGRTAEQLLDSAERLTRPRREAEAKRQPVSGDVLFRGARMVEHDKDAGAEAGLAFLGQVAELGFIASHSNGLDMDAGPATLCCKPDSGPVPEDELRIFPCFDGAPCLRCKPGQPQASPSMLRMRRLILASCWGVSTSGKTFDPERTIGHGILQSPHVDVLVTTLRATRVDPLDMPYLYFLANHGLSLGAVANRANRFRIARGLGADFICFGDPESRTKGSVQVAPSARESDGAYRLRVSAETVAQDVAVSLHGESLPEHPIVITDGDARPNGVCEPGGSLYFTVPARTSEIRYEIVERASLASTPAMRALASDLHFSRSYARDVFKNTQSEESAAARDAIELAEDAIDTSPLLDLVPGIVISRKIVDDSLADIQNQLVTAGYRTMQAFVEGVRKLGTYHPYNLWQERYRFAGTKPNGKCTYCGGTSDEDFFEARTGDSRRSLVACRSCGPTFDGDPKLGYSLESAGRIGAGPLAIELPVTNPYDTSVPACGAAVIIGFDKTTACARGEISAVQIPAGESGAVPVEITVPDTFSPGVHYLCAALMIGGKLQFFRRPLHVMRTR